MAKILATGWVPEDIIGPYREKFDEVLVPSREKGNFTQKEVWDVINNYDVLFTISAFKFQKDLIDHATNIKVVCNLGVGYDNIDAAYCTEKKIAVINTPHAVCQPTAEYTIALIMATMRGVLLYDREVRETHRTASICFFDRDIMLYGKTIGILGCGRIGREVARKAHGLGMNVIYYDPFRQEAFEQEIGAKYCTFDEVIETADVVSCHMPYTKENHHIINKDVFARMKKTAYFVNVARGPIMNERDLIDACRNHVIRGAATDVYENEPVICDEITKLDNIVLSPHIGSNVYEARRGMAEEAMDGSLAVLAGEKPHNIVNPQVLG